MYFLRNKSHGEHFPRRAATRWLTSLGDRRVREGVNLPFMAELSSALAHNVKRLRETAGMSLGQLADRSGVAKATLSKVEKERTNATLDTVAAIADALGVSSTSLLVRADEDALNVLRLGEGVDVSDSVSTGQVLCDSWTGPVQTQIHRVSFHAGISLISPSNGPHSRLHVLARKGPIEVGPVGNTGVLRTGDYAAFPGDRPHLWRPTGKHAAEVWIVHTFLRS